VTLPVVGVDDPAQINTRAAPPGSKGVMLRHGGIVSNARLWVDRSKPDSVGMLLPMPLFYTAGCVMACSGARSARETRADADVRARSVP
jgi:hypothetical protein